MKDLIESLKSSRNVFLKAEGKAIEKWKNLPHSKKGLDLFLKFNIAEVLYGGRSFFCTSNVDLVNRILAILGSEKAISKSGLTSKRDIVLTWDMVEDKPISFSMKETWKILNMIPIDSSNIQLLDNILKGILSNKTSSDKTSEK